MSARIVAILGLIAVLSTSACAAARPSGSTADGAARSEAAPPVAAAPTAPRRQKRCIASASAWRRTRPEAGWCRRRRCPGRPVAAELAFGSPDDHPHRDDDDRGHRRPRRLPQGRAGGRRATRLPRRLADPSGWRPPDRDGHPPRPRRHRHLSGDARAVARARRAGGRRQCRLRTSPSSTWIWTHRLRTLKASEDTLLGLLRRPRRSTTTSRSSGNRRTSAARSSRSRGASRCWSASRTLRRST